MKTDSLSSLPHKNQASKFKSAQREKIEKKKMAPTSTKHSLQKAQVRPSKGFRQQATLLKNVATNFF